MKHEYPRANFRFRRVRGTPLKPMLAGAMQIVVERDSRVASRPKGADPQVVYIYE